MSYSLKLAAPADGAAFGFVLEEFLGDLERGGVAMLFVLHHARDALDAFHHFRIGVAHVLGDEPGELIQVRIGDADHARIAHRAAHDLAEHVAAAFVRREHAIVDQKRRGAGVIGVDAQDGVGAVVFAVGLLEQLAGPVDDRPQQVGVVDSRASLAGRRPCAPVPCRCRWTAWAEASSCPRRRDRTA